MVLCVPFAPHFNENRVRKESLTSLVVVGNAITELKKQGKKDFFSLIGGTQNVLTNNDQKRWW